MTCDGRQLLCAQLSWKDDSDVGAVSATSGGGAAAVSSSNSTGTSFPVTSSRTSWRRRQLPRNKLATNYEEVGDVARPS